MLIQSALRHPLGFVVALLKSKPNVERSPLMASTRCSAQVWLCLRLLRICSYASWDVLTAHWCDSSNLVGTCSCLFAFASVFRLQLTLTIQMTFWPCVFDPSGSLSSCFWSHPWVWSRWSFGASIDSLSNGTKAAISSILNFCLIWVVF